MYSNEHIKFLNRIKLKRFFILISQFSIIILFLLIWQILADLGYINTFIASSPRNVIHAIANLYSTGNLFKHINITVYETIVSFSLGTILGIIIASLLWWNKTLSKIIEPYLTILNSLPKVALGPIIIIWFGAGIKSIIVMALLISLIITIINMLQYFNDTNADKITLLKSFGATKWQIYCRLIIPGNFSNLISSLKINISMSLIGVIMGEFLVSKEGIGYLIMYGSQIFNLNLVMSGIIILCIVASIMYGIVKLIENKKN